MSSTVNACPSCDTTQIYERSKKRPTWRCKRCGHEFWQPTKRSPVQSYKTDG